MLPRPKPANRLDAVKIPPGALRLEGFFISSVVGQVLGSGRFVVYVSLLAISSQRSA